MKHFIITITIIIIIREECLIIYDMMFASIKRLLLFLVMNDGNVYSRVIIIIIYIKIYNIWILNVILLINFNKKKIKIDSNFNRNKKE